MNQNPYDSPKSAYSDKKRAKFFSATRPFRVSSMWCFALLAYVLIPVYPFETEAWAEADLTQAVWLGWAASFVASCCSILCSISLMISWHLSDIAGGVLGFAVALLPFYLAVHWYFFFLA